MSIKRLEHQVFQIASEQEFNEISLEIFHYQVRNNLLYKQYTESLGVNIKSIDHPTKIPFLPVEFFKNHQVVASAKEADVIFSSSGTTGSIVSKHYVSSLAMYETSFLSCFELFYGSPTDYLILALLPSYLERSGSSLVYMMEKLIKASGSLQSGFYLDSTGELLKQLRNTDKKVFLLGVSFALLDLADIQKVKVPGAIIMETGGMKGRKREMIREELHDRLKNGLGVSTIHSEYGMTELLSQAYSKGNGKFYAPPWMKILIRDTNDPLSLAQVKKSGGINVIDLANLYSCSFIATQDLGKINPDGSFEVLGRFDTSDIRGCNLMVV